MIEVNKVKKIFVCLIFILSIYLGMHYQKQITSFILREFVYKKEISEYQVNSYAKDTSYTYVKATDNFYPKNKEDIKNAIYTILNSGMESFNLFCPDEYAECLDDVEEISTDYDILSNINNLVHPYNSYNKLYVTTNSLGKVNIRIEKLYSSSDIEYVNSRIDEIKAEILNNDMKDRDKIKAFHDYVINNTVYDSDRAEELKENIATPNTSESNKATGVLQNHIALCSGYTDLMAIFLSDIGISNYKIATKDHVWNAVYLDNNWYHLDLTWDDPVVNTGENILIYDFFLITTDELENINTNQHKYDKTVYGF